MIIPLLTAALSGQSIFGSELNFRYGYLARFPVGEIGQSSDSDCCLMACVEDRIYNRRSLTDLITSRLHGECSDNGNTKG
jgi:hypothetical protein